MLYRSYLLLFLLTVAGCGSLPHFPSPSPGWHSPNYSVVFGVLERSGKTPPIWTLRYAGITAADPYGGQFVLAPASLLTGYSNGDLVEVTGRPPALPAKSPLEGRVAQRAKPAPYQVSGIRLWLGIGRPTYLTR